MKGNQGYKHWNWRGDEVGYSGVHKYIKKELPKPEVCPSCKKSKKLDASCKGIYDRNLENWEWLCHSCHLSKDKINSGMKNGMRKLNEEEVLEIRSSKLITKELMRKYSISLATVYRIKCKKTWKSL